MCAGLSDGLSVGYRPTLARSSPSGPVDAVFASGPGLERGEGRRPESQSVWRAVDRGHARQVVGQPVPNEAGPPPPLAGSPAGEICTTPRRGDLGSVPRCPVAPLDRNADAVVEVIARWMRPRSGPPHGRSAPCKAPSRTRAPVARRRLLRDINEVEFLRALALVPESDHLELRLVGASRSVREPVPPNVIVSTQDGLAHDALIAEYDAAHALLALALAVVSDGSFEGPGVLSHGSPDHGVWGSRQSPRERACGCGRDVFVDEANPRSVAPGVKALGELVASSIDFRRMRSLRSWEDVGRDHVQSREQRGEDSVSQIRLRVLSGLSRAAQPLRRAGLHRVVRIGRTPLALSAARPQPWGTSRSGEPSSTERCLKPCSATSSSHRRSNASRTLCTLAQRCWTSVPTSACSRCSRLTWPDHPGG